MNEKPLWAWEPRGHWLLRINLFVVFRALFVVEGYMSLLLEWFLKFNNIVDISNRLDTVFFTFLVGVDHYRNEAPTIVAISTNFSTVGEMRSLARMTPSVNRGPGPRSRRYVASGRA